MLFLLHFVVCRCCSCCILLCCFHEATSSLRQWSGRAWPRTLRRPSGPSRPLPRSSRLAVVLAISCWLMRAGSCVVVEALCLQLCFSAHCVRMRQHFKCCAEPAAQKEEEEQLQFFIKQGEAAMPQHRKWRCRCWQAPHICFLSFVLVACRARAHAHLHVSTHIVCFLVAVLFQVVAR